MTWWAAHLWCKNQGCELATLSQACNNFVNSGDASCQNLKGVSSVAVWTATPKNSKSAYYLLLSTGTIGGDPQHYHTNPNTYAICY